MELTAAQKTTLKTFILADGTLGPKATAGDYDGVANGLNAVQDYWGWRSSVNRFEIYKASVSAGDSSTGSATTWDWTGYKNQGATEQDAWKEMFMGGAGCDFGNQPNRNGFLAIFGTAGAGGANRTHIFNAGRRKVTLLEKVFATAVVNPPNNTGNNSGDARGLKTNPDVLTVEGFIGPGEIGGVLS